MIGPLCRMKCPTGPAAPHAPVFLKSLSIWLNCSKTFHQECGLYFADEQMIGLLSGSALQTSDGNNFFLRWYKMIKTLLWTSNYIWHKCTYILLRIRPDNSLYNENKHSKAIKMCNSCKMETLVILESAQPSLWQRKDYFEFDTNYNPYPTLSLFSRQIYQYSHTWMGPTWNKQKHDDYFVFFPASHWITYFMPPLQLPNVSNPSCSLSNRRSIALLTCDGQCLLWPW